MISKVIIGKTFYGACKYVCADQKRAIILETEGVRDYDYKLMATDFERQHALRESLSKVVFHGILSFYPGEKLEDKMMTQIAREYMQNMKIKDTQYAIVKHTDKEHTHLHILANLVNNQGHTIKDNWIGLKGKKVAQTLTKKYVLKEALTKDLSKTNIEALSEKETTRYIIYQAILNQMKVSKNLDHLEHNLTKYNIEVLYKYKGQTEERQGISFKLGDYKFKGSEVDRKLSLTNLQKELHIQDLRNHFLRPERLTAFNRINDHGTSDKAEQTHNLSHQKSTVLEELLKPHIQNNFVPKDFILAKKTKKKKRGFRL